MTKTTPITKFDKPRCKRLGEEVEAMLAELGARYGLKVQYAGGSFEDIEFTCRVKFKVMDEAAEEKAAKGEYLRHCMIFDLGPEHYGAEFLISGERYKLIGIAPSRAKYPLRVRRLADGKVTLHTDAIVPRIKETVAGAKAEVR